MNRRPELTPIFKRLIGNDNVYFQPPESLEMQYPCIRYQLSGIKQTKANNKLYNYTQEYEVVYITREPDSKLVDEMLGAFEMISFKNAMVVDNLYHYRYKLYY